MPEPWEPTRDLLVKLAAGRDLTVAEASAAMEAFISGTATAAQAGAFLTALRMKGEAATEIAGCALKLQERFSPLDLGMRPESIVEMSGTGVERAASVFPITIAAALLAAASGVKVVQEATAGRAGAVGNADVLAALGLNVTAPVATLMRCMQELGIAFIPEESYGETFSRIEQPGREIGFRTVLRLLRAVVSHVGAKRQVIGVYNEKIAETVAHVLKKVGMQHAMVVHGLDGLDHITTTGKSKVCEVKDGAIDTQYIQPESFGLKRAPLGAYSAKTAEEGAMILNGVLSGQQGPARDVVILNAAAAIRVGGFASSFDKAVEVAKRSLGSGRPKEVLEKLIKISLL